MRAPWSGRVFLIGDTMRLGIVGTGRVGASFVLALQHVPDIEIIGVMASSWEKSCRIGHSYGVTPYADGGDLVQDCDVVLLTVPDDAISHVSANLAALLAHRTQGQSHSVILHCSGAMGLEPLRPLQALGYAVGSLHPLQSFACPDGTQLQHIYMAVAGDEEAQNAANRLVSLLGSISFTVPDDKRAVYHGAACFASNFIVTAMAVGQSLLRPFMATQADAAKALLPLIMGTMHNIAQQDDFGKALTGPIARGDAGTVAKHVAALDGENLAAYTSFATVTARVALQEGRISREQYDHFLSILAVGKGDFNEQES